MKLETVDNHSFFPDLLTPGGAVLDVGARGFVFAKEMARRGHRVIAMEPDPSGMPYVVEVPREGSIDIAALALVGSGQPARQRLSRWDNGEANRLITPATPASSHPSADVIEVLCADVEFVTRLYGSPTWDLVKMNCEGAEFDVLRTWPGPIARQLSVSFHDHTGANPGGEATYQEILAHLGKWYEVIRHVWEERYCAGGSYWDSVITLRGLVPAGVERRMVTR